MRYIILFFLLSFAAVGCRTVTDSRANKDITGINEQLYEFEKNQIKDSNRLKVLEGQVKLLSENKVPVKEKNEKNDDKDEDVDKIYKEGYQNYLDQKYSDAIKTLSRLTSRFKDDALTDNALYWQAESYAKTNQPDRALKYYQMVYRYYPFSNKADYALYKIGLIYVDLNDNMKAILAFNRLLEDYPNSDLFKTVSLKLKEIKDKNTKKK